MSSNKKIGNLCAFLALIFIVGIMALNLITGWLEIDLGVISRIIMLIKDVAILLALGIGGYEYTASKSSTMKIIFWVALVLYLVFVFFGIKF